MADHKEPNRKRLKSDQGSDDLEMPKDKQSSLKGNNAQAPLTLLILVGVPGSGKSTFSEALIQSSTQKWSYVNQDSINNGKRGTKEQCLSAERAALNNGTHVIIDRTNVTPDQRQPFIQLAKENGAERIYCVMLRLPVKVCGARAAARKNHNAGVSGPRAYATVGMMQKALNEAGDPQLTEGFDALLVCETDEEIAAALNLLIAHGTDNTADLGADLGTAWEKVRPEKKKVPEIKTIDKFFKKTGVTASEGKGGAKVEKPEVGIQDKGPSASTHGAKTGKGDAHQADRDQAEAAGPTAAAPPQPPSSGNAFSVLMASAKQQAHSPAKQAPPASKATSSAAPSTRHTFGASPYLNALLSNAQSPESLFAANPQGGVFYDSQCMVFADKYPKAKFHALVVARDTRLQGPLDLKTPDDIPLVRHMKEVGARWAQEQAPGVEVAMGFHSAPSMRQLHLHVISKDYDSPCLKTKKHWNSFTTLFFLDVDTVIAQMEAKASRPGGCYLDYDVSARENLLKGPLRCHRCSSVQRNMPLLKEHIKTCRGVDLTQ